MSKKHIYSVPQVTGLAVDAEAGTIRNIAIMTEGEALGHGLRVDRTTLQTLYSLGKDGGVKAFLNHLDQPSPTDAVGVFSGFFIDAENGLPAKLRATFKAFKAFKLHAAKEYLTLFELATEAPKTFGMSVSIYQDEEEASDGGFPFIRPTSFDSADFVSRPAANKAIYSEESLDVSHKQIQPVVKEPIQSVSADQIQPKPIFKMREIYAKYSASPKKLTRAVQLMAESDKATEAAVIETVEAEASVEEVAALRKAVADLTKERDDLAAKVGELTGDVEKMAAPAAEVPALKEANTKLSADLGEAKKSIAEMATRLSRYGVSPLKLAAKTDKAAPAATCSATEFSAKTALEKMEFSRAGGRIIENLS